MHNVISVESAVKPVLHLEVGDKNYTVEFPLSAVIEAEAAVGHSLKTPQDWYGAPAKDIPALLEAGLKKHHPEVTTEEVRVISDGLDPEACNTFTEALGALAFPKFTARLKENIERAKQGFVPKEQSADAL